MILLNTNKFMSNLNYLLSMATYQLNEQLPSIRQLADSLQVSRNTTLMAYDQLVAEGYIRGEGRKGYFVNELEPLLFQEESVPIHKKQTESVTTILS